MVTREEAIARFHQDDTVVRCLARPTQAALVPRAIERVQELSNAWFFPLVFIGSVGLVVDKEDGRLFRFGSAFGPDTWIWAYERGFRWDLCDLVVTEVREMDRALQVLDGLNLARRGWGPKRSESFSGAELTELLAQLPARFPSQKLWMSFDALQAMDAHPPFTYVIERPMNPTVPAAG
jgi:hypothetical protein